LGRCGASDAWAEYALAEALYYNRDYYSFSEEGWARPLREAEKRYLSAAKKGLWQAQDSLVHFLVKYRTYGTGDSDIGEWRRKAAEAPESPPSMKYAYGVMLLAGSFVQQDKARAARFIREAAANGHREAQWASGQMLLNGEGIPQDKCEALSWFRKSVEWRDPEIEFAHIDARYRREDLGHGNPVEQLSLGKMIRADLLRGDPGEDALWFQKAVERFREWGEKFKDCESQWYLACMYRDGVGVSQDNDMAIQWFRKAAQDGEWRVYSLEARLELGIMLRNSRGAFQNRWEGTKLLCGIAFQRQRPELKRRAISELKRT
jgi:TPR repeat protein